MTARREPLAELDRLTTDLTHRTDAWMRQLRAVEAYIPPAGQSRIGRPRHKAAEPDGGASSGRTEPAGSTASP